MRDLRTLQILLGALCQLLQVFQGAALLGGKMDIHYTLANRQNTLTNKAEELIQVCLTLVPERDLLLVSFIHGEKRKS